MGRFVSLTVDSSASLRMTMVLDTLQALLTRHGALGGWMDELDVLA